MRLLILGGTSEASALAKALVGRDDLSPVLSLAGRTEHPVLPPIPYRIGGFGGIDGLAAYLSGEQIEAVIDATHPFAERISAHAVAACGRTKVPLACFTRAAWTPRPGDIWRLVPDLHAAATALGADGRRVLLTTGRLGLAAFKQAPQHHYLIRAIDPPAVEDRPPDHEILLARGPFAEIDEERLMRQRRVDILVTKNSGGRASAAKLDAARTLGLPVIVVERHDVAGQNEVFTSLDAVLGWIEAHRGTAPTDAAP